MVRLLSFRLPQIHRYWRHGLLLSSDVEKVFVEFDPAQCALSVTIRSEDKDIPSDRGEILLPLPPSQIDNIAGRNRRKTKRSKKEKPREKEIAEAPNKRISWLWKKNPAQDENEALAPDEASKSKEEGTEASSGDNSGATSKGMHPFQLLSVLVFSTIDALVRDWFQVLFSALCSLLLEILVWLLISLFQARSTCLRAMPALHRQQHA